MQPVLLWASKSDVRHFKPLGSLAYSCTAALPSSSSRQLAGLPLLFLWASKSDVRHFAPPLNPPRAFKPFPAPLAYSCIAALLASGGSLGREPWNVQPVLLWASKSHFAPPLPRIPAPSCRRREPGEACLFSSYGLPKATLGLCTAFKPPARLQTLPSAFGVLLHRSLALPLRQAGAWGESPSPAAANPPQRLWRTPASQPCLAASGGSLGREPLPRGCKPSPAPLAYSCTAALPSSSSRQLAGLPLLFLWASKSDVRHFAPPLNPPRAFKPFPAPLAYSCIAALLASGGSLGREPWNVQPVLLWASKSDVRHFKPLGMHRSLALFLFSAARRPASSQFGLLLHRSLAQKLMGR